MFKTTRDLCMFRTLNLKLTLFVWTCFFYFYLMCYERLTNQRILKLKRPPRVMVAVVANKRRRWFGIWILFIYSKVLVANFGFNWWIEMVKGKDPRQVEQLGSIRQGYLRQISQGSARLQTDHSIGCVWASQNPRLFGPSCSYGIVVKKYDFIINVFCLFKSCFS